MRKVPKTLIVYDKDFQDSSDLRGLVDLKSEAYGKAHKADIVIYKGKETIILKNKWGHRGVVRSKGVVIP